MKISIAHSNDPAQCAEQLRKGCLAAPKLVLFFASPQLDVARAAEILHLSFPQSEVVGCSSAACRP